MEEAKGKRSRVEETEAKHAEDLVRRHRREVAEARARIVELETYIFGLEHQLTEAKAAVGHMTMLVLRAQANKK